VHERRGLAPLVKTHHFLLKCIKGEVYKKWWALTSGDKPLLVCTSIKGGGF
jgi:hypothetical protein